MYSREYRPAKRKQNQSLPTTSQVDSKEYIYQPKIEEVKPEQNPTDVQSKTDDETWLNSGRIDGADTSSPDTLGVIRT